MRKFITIPIAAVLAFVSCDSQPTVVPDELIDAPQFSAGGFDEFGYNYGARVFVGLADGVDRNLDGTVWGDPTYANDLLKMKWNAEWDRGNDEGWTDPNGYDAWTDNQWNGRMPGGSGEVWHYMVKWVGECHPQGSPGPNGGYCIWGQFEVTADHGTILNEHYWYAHATPTGYVFP
jgi:hypothetical protein